MIPAGCQEWLRMVQWNNKTFLFYFDETGSAAETFCVSTVALLKYETRRAFKSCKVQRGGHDRG